MSDRLLVKNIVALGLSQVASYLIALATLPLATRALGVEVWGQVTFVLVVFNYCGWITNWSFHLSATERIANARSEREAYEVAANAWAAQWSLAIGVVAVVTMVYVVRPTIFPTPGLFVAGVTLVVANVMCPVWIFSGLQRMHVLSPLQIGMRFAAIPATYFFVKEPSDAPLYVLFTALATGMAGSIGLYAVLRSVKAQRPGVHAVGIWKEIRDGAPLFVTTGWASFYNSIVPVIVGAVAGSAALGIYGVAERAKSATQAAISPVNNALFPAVVKRLALDPAGAARLLLMSGSFVIILSMALSLFLWFGAESIIRLLAGDDFAPAATVLRIMAPLPFLTTISTFIGIQILVPYHRRTAFYAGHFCTGLIVCALTAPFVLDSGGAGAAVALLVAEGALASGLVGYVLFNLRQAIR